MDNVMCTGAEETLFDCHMNSLGEHDCGDFEHIHLECGHESALRQGHSYIVEVY